MLTILLIEKKQIIIILLNTMLYKNGLWFRVDCNLKKFVVFTRKCRRGIRLKNIIICSKKIKEFPTNLNEIFQVATNLPNLSMMIGYCLPHSKHEEFTNSTEIYQNIH